MSHQAVQEVLERTLSDESFRARLFSTPQVALEGYELTDDETIALRALTVEAETAGGAGGLDQRQSKRALWLDF